MRGHRGVANRAPLAAAGLWWRASRYEIWNHGYIRPVEGATFEQYDPWNEYTRTWERRSSNRLTRQETGAWRRVPYRSLAEVGPPTRSGESPSMTIEIWNERLRRIVAWCNEHGLLGILPHRALFAELAPRWSSPLPKRADHLVPGRVTHTRIGARWLAWSQQRVGSGTWCLTNEPEQHGELVPADMRPEGWRPRVIVVSDNARKIEEHGLGNAWGRYFPDIPAGLTDTFHYPTPGSRTFWRQYAEPVDDFLQYAHRFRGVLRDLADPAQRDEWATLDLETLTRVVTPRAALEGRVLRQRWASPSLIGHLAMMLLLDNSEGRRPLQCECGVLFLSAAWQGRYCSESCRWRFGKRRQRVVAKGRPPRLGRHVRGRG